MGSTATPVLDEDACREVAKDFFTNYVKNSNRIIDLSDYTLSDIGLWGTAEFQYYQFSYYKKAENGYILTGDHLTARVNLYGELFYFSCGDDLSHFEELYPTINYDLADQRATELAQQLCKAHESLGLTYELINLKEYQNPEGNIFYMVYAMVFEYEYEGKTIEGTTKIIIPL